MTEPTNDILLKNFFDKNRKEIADNGFSQRVMRHIPRRDTNKLAQLWSWCGVSLALLLFLALDAGQEILTTLKETFAQTILTGLIQLDWQAMFVAVIVLLILAYHRICSLA